MAGELRITGGRLARRRIAVPAAADRGSLRPTSDKVREALMSSLGDVLDDARVLDLFAGSGALGLEALSRGAAHATFVEHDRRTARTLEENIASLDLRAQSTVRHGDARKVLRALDDAAFDVIFIDPPYADPIEGLLGDLARVLTPAGRLVIERDRRTEPFEQMGLSLLRDRRYGDTRVFVYAKPGASPGAGESDAKPGASPGAGESDAKPGASPGAGETDAKPGPTSGAGENSVSTAAIYPGSFDPITMGHVDIVERGLRTFGRVVLAVANNPQKSHLFSIEERIELAKKCLGHLQGLEIDTFDGLIVEYARKKNINVLLRGLRAVSDFEYEFQLAGMNRKLQPDVETVFMVTSEESFYLSSRLVREVASFGGNVKGMVPEAVLEALTKKYARKS